MNDQRRRQLVEQYEDIALSLLMDDYAAEEGAKLLKEFEAAEKNGELPEFPDDLDEKCRKLIDKSFAKRERNNLLTRIGKAALKVAVFALVFIGLAATTVMSVDALRVPVLNFFMQHTDRYSILVTDNQTGDNLSQADNWEDRLEALIPEDYALVAQDQGIDGRTRLVYQNPDGYIISFLATPATDTYNFDSENARITETKLNNYDAILIETDGLRLIWGDPEAQMLFDLYSNGLDANLYWEIAYTLAD